MNVYTIFSRFMLWKLSLLSFQTKFFICVLCQIQNQLAYKIKTRNQDITHTHPHFHLNFRLLVKCVDLLPNKVSINICSNYFHSWFLIIILLLISIWIFLFAMNAYIIMYKQTTLIEKIWHYSSHSLSTMSY